MHVRISFIYRGIVVQSVTVIEYIRRYGTVENVHKVIGYPCARRHRFLLADHQS